MGAPVGSILEYTLVGEVNAQLVETVLHYVVVTESILTPGGNEENAFMAQIGVGGPEDLVTPYLAACSQDYTLFATRAQFIYPTRYAYVEIPTTDPGTIASPCAAQNVAGVITKRTQFAGRKQVGAVHMPGVPNNGYAAGSITGTQKTHYENVADQMLLNPNPTGTAGLYRPIIWHRNTTPLPTFDVWSIYTVQDTLRTMRRRNLRIGV